MMKTQIAGRFRYLTCFLVILFLMFAVSTPVFADTDVIFTTNGSNHEYIPGSTMIVYGKLLNKGYGVPKASVTVEIELAGESVFFASPKTDSEGYFKTGFNIPTSASPGDELIVRVNEAELSYELTSLTELLKDDDPLQVIGFIKGTEGSLTDPATGTISSTGKKLGVIFNKNVNFFRDGRNIEGLEDLGKIDRNASCFTLYENGKKVPIKINLIEKRSEDSSNISTYIFAPKLLPNNLSSKNVIYVEPTNGLKADTEYRLTISGNLINNGGIPLENDVTIYYKTAKAGENPTGGAGGSSSGEAAVDGITGEETGNADGSAVTFTDLGASWAASDIYYLVERGIVNGKGNGTFAPNDLITRAEVVTILARMSEADLSAYTQTPFKDVKQTDWYANAVAWASEAGITNGDTEGNFRPKQNISRQDLAVMIGRYVEKIEKVSLPENNQAVTFQDDNIIAGYAKGAVAEMQKAGIINGRENNIFAPLDNATRAEACAILARLIRML